MIMSCYNEIRTRDTAYSLAKGSPQNDNEVQFAERLRRIPGFIGHFSAISKWTPFTFYVHSCLPPDSPKYDYPKMRLQDQSGIAMETINSVQQSSFMGKWSEVRTKMGNFEIPVDMVPPHIAAFAERFVMLAYSLWRAKDIEDIIQTIMWFSLSMTEQSIAMKIVDYVREILTEDQFSGMSLLETIKSTRDDWTAVTASPLFDQISQLLSCMVALGICTATTVDFDIKGVKLFAVASRSSQYNAATLMQATLDSLVFFLEGGYLCFQKGSFRPLLCSDTEVEKFLESYDQVIMKSKLVRGGNLERLGYGTEAEYDKQLQDLILSTAILTKSCNAKSEKMMLEKKLSEIKNLKVDFQQFKNTEGLREAPWCVGIYGNSSVGKSSLTQIIISAILHSQNLPCTQDYTYTLKSNDAYMSGYKSYFQAIIYDDMGNTKPNFVKNAPTEPLIDIVNNVRYFANMAELELKGKVSVEPKVVVVTKNPKDGGASHYSMEPVSIARRERFLIKPTPRKKFTTNNMLDSDKIMDYYGKIPSFPDAWTFDVQQAYPIIQENGPAEVGYMTVAVGINLMQLMSIFYEDSARFYVAQASLVANANNLPKAIKEKSCTSCRRLFQCCICNDKPDLCGTTCFKCEMPVELCACESGPVEQSMIFPTVDVKELIQLEGVPDTLYNQPNIEPLDDKPDVENQTGSLFEWAFGIWCAKKLSGIRKMKEWMTKVEDVTTTTLEKNLKTMERSIPLFLLGLLPETWTDGYVTQWLFDHLYDKTITRINSLNKILFYTQMGGMVSLIDWGSLFTKGLTDPKGLSLLIPGTACVIMGSLLQAAFVGTEEEETVIETRNKMWGIGGVISMTILPWSTSIPVYGRALGMLSFSALGNMYLFKVQKGMRRAFEHESTGLRVTARSIRQRVKTSLQTKCMVAAGILTAIKMYKMYASTRISEQGKLNPFSIKDIWKRDEEVNVWKQPVLSKIPVHPKLKNMTHDQVIEKVFSNLCYFEARRKKLIGTTAVGYCDALFICSNVALIPYHIFKEGTDMKCTFYRHGPDTVGGTFHHLMTEDTIYRIPNTDFCLVWVPSGGDWADIRHLLSGTNPEAGPASIVYKTDEGEKEITNTFAKFRELTPTYCTYYGGEYEFLSNKRPSGTFNGLCMATLVSQKRDNQIIGFHLAGRGTYGVCGVLTKSQCDAAIECLGSKEGVVLSCSSGTMPTDQYGVNFEYKAEIHPKSPVNFLEKGNFSMYGSIRGRTKAFSQVRVSSLSEHILTVCGVPNKWGPPNFKQGGTNYPFQASLVHSSDPMSFVPLPLLNAAKNDYIEGILYKMNSIPESKDHLRPLSNDAIVNGIPGVRFIDGMKMSTSPGFPLTGSKDLYVTEYDGIRELDPIFYEQARAMEHEFEHGRRDRKSVV